MVNAELLIEKVKALPEDSAAEVLDFVDYLEQKAVKQRAAAGDSPDAERECPLCAKHRDPVTGEPRFNAETIAAMQEVQDQIDGKVPVKWYASLDEMWECIGQNGLD
jgi:hypothetical protein